MSFIKKKMFLIPQKVNGWYLWRKDKKEFITCVNYEKDVAKFKIRPNDIKLDLTNIKQHCNGFFATSFFFKICAFLL